MKSRLAGIQISQQHEPTTNAVPQITVFDAQIESELKGIHHSRQDDIRCYLASMLAKNRKMETLHSTVHAILTLETVGKDYNSITSDDMIAWMQMIDKNYAANTVQLYRSKVKNFLNWTHNGNDEDAVTPAAVKVIKIKTLRPDYRKHVLSKEEVILMIRSARSQRDRSLIFCLYESGCRAAEILGLRIQDAVFNEQGGYIVVNGKTGSRRIPLIESIPELQLWLNMHPYKDDKTCPIWTTAGTGKKGMEYMSLYQIVITLAKRAGLSNDISPHSLRHASATHHATKLNEFQMRQLYGWAPSSTTPSRYVHLSGRDLDDAVRAYNGLPTTSEQAKLNPTKPKECARCHKENSAVSHFCAQCGMALDFKTAVDLQEHTMQADVFTADVLTEVMKRVPDLLAKIIAEKGGIDKINNITTGELTFTNSMDYLQIFNRTSNDLKSL